MTSSPTRLALATGLLGALSASAASAQIPFDWSFVTPYLRLASTAEWDDLDGDGIEDILLTSVTEGLVWSRHEGGGEFGPLRVIDGAAGASLVRSFDVDGDGITDVVTSTGLLNWYRGLGAGEFGPKVSLGAGNFSVLRMLPADMNQDGLTDIVWTQSSPPGVFWLPNQGGGSFGTTQTIAAPVPGGISRGLAIADVDMDGDLDVAYASFAFGSGSVFAVENLGGAGFATPTLAGTGISQARGVGFGDFNGDGRMDLAATGISVIAWYERAGTGFSWSEQDRRSIFTSPRAMEVADATADGREEIIVCSWIQGVVGFQVDPLTGDLMSSAYDLELAAEEGALIADVNGDGNLDLVGPDNGCEVALGLGSGSFAERKPLIDPHTGVSTYITVDYDGDGDLDVLGAGTSTADGVSTILLHERLSDRDFARPVPLVDPVSSAFFPELGDLNGNGIDDLFFVRAPNLTPTGPYTLQARERDASGALGAERVLFRLAQGSALYISPKPVDLDADGDLDLIITPAVSGTPPTIDILALWNDGVGGFAASTVIASGSDLAFRGLMDVDGDGRLDLITSTSTVAAQVHPGDPSSATGFGAPIETPGTPSTSTGTVVAIDIDVDGDCDLVILGRRLTASGWQISAYLNSPSGFGQEILGDAFSHRGPFGDTVDWDLDGDLDIVFGDGSSDSIWILESSPAGLQPRRVVEQLPPGANSSGIPYLRFGDADADGDPDVWVQIRRQLRLVRNLTEIGASLCAGVPNSTGAGAELSGSGTDDAGVNRLVLTASSLPPSATTLFLVSRSTGTSQPPGSQGTLCLGGAIGRYVQPGQVQTSTTFGTARLALDLTQTPDPATGPGAAVAGETLFFQAWYRDANPAVTSNFSQGVAVNLR